MSDIVSAAYLRVKHVTHVLCWQSGPKKERWKDVVTPRRLGSGRRSGHWAHSGDDGLKHPLLAAPTGPQSN